MTRQPAKNLTPASSELPLWNVKGASTGFSWGTWHAGCAADACHLAAQKMSREDGERVDPCLFTAVKVRPGLRD